MWTATRPLLVKLLPRIMLGVAALNSVAMMYFVPLVLKEGVVNAATRMPFETSIARQLESFPEGVPILMHNVRSHWGDPADGHSAEANR